MRASKRTELSRRDFARVAATAAVVPLLPAWAQARDEPKSPSRSPVRQAAGKEGSEEGPSAEAAALAGVVRMRYGSRLDEAALKAVTRGIDGNLKAAATLRKVPLQNSDEPAFLFRAWRGGR